MSRSDHSRLPAAQPEIETMDRKNKVHVVRKPDGAHLLRFLFVGSWRNWNPGGGFTPPQGKVCVLRSLPGNVVTWASSVREAEFKMRMALSRALSSDGPEWYESAKTGMSKEDNTLRSKLWDRVWEEGRPTQTETLTTDRMTSEQVESNDGDLHFAGGAECVVLVESVRF